MPLHVFCGGVADPTSQFCLGIWPDVAGDYTISLSTGQSATVNIGTVADYQGCTFVDFAGLSGNVTYSVSGPSGTVTDSIQLATGSRHKTAVSSCWNDNFWFEQTAAAIDADGVNQCVTLGDFPYCDNQRQMSILPTVGNLRYQMQRTVNRSCVQSMLRHAAWFAVTSDHDAYLGNDAPGQDDVVPQNGFTGDAACNYYVRLHSLPDVISPLGEASSVYKNWPSADPQEAWEQLMTESEAVYDATHRNPVNPDAGIDFGGGVVPADAPYTRWTVGRVEYFLTEMFRYCDYRSNSAINRSMLGTHQLAWLLARVAASTADFKVILSPQMTLKSEDYATAVRNDYGHACYQTEAEALKDGLTDFTGWVKPGGVVVYAGDVHTPQVHFMDRNEGLLQITPCPAGTGFVDQPAGVDTSPDTKMIWWETYPSGGYPVVRYYGLIEDTGSGPLICQLKDSAGRVRYEARITAGSNAPAYRARLVG